MSRRGKGRGFRGGIPSIDRNAPEPELDGDLDEDDKKDLTKPTPLFAVWLGVDGPIKLPQPKPFTESEQNAIYWHQEFRNSMRDSPLFTDLDPGIVTNDEGKANARVGIDPFEAIGTYGQKYAKSERKFPDFSRGSYALEFFPFELWSTIDPERKQAVWKTVSKGGKQKLNRRRKQDDAAPTLTGNTMDSEGESDPEIARVEKRKRPEVDEDDEDEDITAYRRRRRQRAKVHDPTKKRSGEKQGLDAEDEIEEDEADKLGKDDGEDDVSDDTISDSHFSDDEEGQEGDYGDNFFDPGEDDGDGMDDDLGGGGEDEGGTY
ncbi:MAG: hypothetical protein Q9160_006961 [Pyrenula sp. 1 TL-2023]